MHVHVVYIHHISNFKQYFMLYCSMFYQFFVKNLKWLLLLIQQWKTLFHPLFILDSQQNLFALFVFIVLLLNQHQVLVVYLNLSSYNSFWNNYSRAKDQLCNHLFDLLEFFEYYHMLLTYFLLVDEKSFVHYS